MTMDMQTKINRGLLKFHVMTAMFCQLCQQVLDTPKAVSVETPKSTFCVCAKCWGQHGANFRAAVSRERLTVEILDGRELFPSKRKRGSL